jgi:hypothetical protein
MFSYHLQILSETWDRHGILPKKWHFDNIDNVEQYPFAVTASSDVKRASSNETLIALKFLRPHYRSTGPEEPTAVCIFCWNTDRGHLCFVLSPRNFSEKHAYGHLLTIAISFRFLGFLSKSRVWPWSLSIKRMVHSMNFFSTTLTQIGFNLYAIPSTLPSRFLIGDEVTERGKRLEIPTLFTSTRYARRYTSGQ